MRSFGILLILLFSAAHAQAEKPLPVYFKVLELGKARDFAGLQQLFDDIEAERIETGDAARHTTAFNAFYNTHPVIEETVISWLGMHPEAPHPYVARAARLNHEAIFVRSSDTVAQTPSRSMQRMRDLMDEALPLVEQALALDPTHPAAAENLRTIGVWRGPRSLTDRARQIKDAYTTEEEKFWAEIYRFQPQWGGSAAETTAYCEWGADVLGKIDLEECLLIAAIGKRPRDVSAEELRTRLKDGFPGRWRGHLINLTIETGRVEEAKELMAEDYPPGHGRLERILNDDTADFVLERSLRRLEDTPRHPTYLRLVSVVQTYWGDPEDAAETIERALELGSTMPLVRAQQIVAYTEAGRPDEVVVSAIEDAIEQTDGNPWVFEAAYNYAVSGLLQPDGTALPGDDPAAPPMPENACWRKQLFDVQPQFCAAYPHTHTCWSGFDETRAVLKERFDALADCG